MDHIRIISFFLSSPSDLNHERKLVYKIAEDINTIIVPLIGCEIRILTWENDTVSGISSTSVQDLLDEQIGEFYDIYIGMMYTRFGTPTGNYDSGTEQEFINAIRFLSEGKISDIAFLFKSQINEVEIDQIDLTQLNLVRTFKKRIQKDGVYTRDFKNDEEFKRLLKSTIVEKIKKVLNNYEIPLIGDIETEEYSDLTLDEIQDDVNELAEIVESDLNLISIETTNIGEVFTVYTNKLSRFEFKVSSDVQRFKPAINKLLNEVSSEMINYSRSIVPLTRSMKTNYFKFLDSLKESIFVSISDSEELEVIEDAKLEMVNLNRIISESKDKVLIFKANIEGLPNINSSIKRAKREVSNALQELEKGLSELVERSKIILEL